MREKVKEFFDSTEQTDRNEPEEGELPQSSINEPGCLELGEGVMAEPLRNNEEENTAAENDDLQFLDSAIEEVLGNNEENNMPEFDLSHFQDDFLADFQDVDDEENAPPGEQDDNK